MLAFSGLGGSSLTSGLSGKPEISIVSKAAKEYMGEGAKKACVSTPSSFLRPPSRPEAVEDIEV